MIETEIPGTILVKWGIAERMKGLVAPMCGAMLISLWPTPSLAKNCQNFDTAYSRFAVTQHVGSADLAQCVNDSGGVTDAMRECMRIETNRLKRMLPPTLEKAEARTRRQCGGRAGNTLRQSQEIWRKSHGKRCATEMQGGGGGTAGLLIGDSCVMNEHRRRLEWLKKL
jgi:uncharacterized protein YecT (DUF1311 family)